MTNHFSSQKFDFGPDKDDGGGCSSNSYCTEPIVASYLSRDYPVGIFVVINLMLLFVMVKLVSVLVPPTYTSRMLIVGLMVVIWFHLGVSIIHK